MKRDRSSGAARALRAGACVLAVSSLGLTGCFRDIGITPGPGPFPDGGVAIGPDGFCGRGGAPDTAGLPEPTFEGSTADTAALPALSGGTLAVVHDTATSTAPLAVASDPDRDGVWLVPLAGMDRTPQWLALSAHDEPGRIAEDAAGNVHVVLRGAGAIADIDLTTPTPTVTRRSVCAAPRGIAYQPGATSADPGTLHVACVSGALVSLSADSALTATTRVQLDNDLRDVVYDSVSRVLLVSRFRSAELLEVVPGSATPVYRFSSEGIADVPGFMPDVAWHTVGLPTGGVLMLHQEASATEICPSPGGYGVPDPGGPSAAIVRPAATAMIPGAAPTVARRALNELSAGLTIDVAVSADNELAFAVAGAVNGNMLPRVVRVLSNGSPVTIPANLMDPSTNPFVGQAVAVAYTRSGTLLVQTRARGALAIVDRSNTVATVPLGEDTVHNVGHTVFHASTAGGLSCAGCHPEGGEDGHTWSFTGSGQRRTQSLRGNIAGTAPFHWDGDLADMSALLDNVYHGRMSGPELSPAQAQSLSTWMDTIPTIPHETVTDQAQRDSIARGQALFNGAAGCVGCHSGERFSNNTTFDVGTGRPFQTPSLRGVAFRLPVMHNGCATTLAGRFDTTCGGNLHGTTATLDAVQRADLVHYLETL